MPFLVMTLLVRDEADILEANLTHHLNQGVDLVIATDNNSTDDTPEILSRFQRHGVLRLIREPALTYDQVAWVTRMALLAHELGADWVINNDADEFLWPLSGDLQDVFSVIPFHYGSLEMPRTDVLSSEPIDRDIPFYSRMTMLEVQSEFARGRVLYPKFAHRASPAAEVAYGSHSVAGIGPPVPNWHPVTILHYPLRSYEQYERKVRNLGDAYLRGGWLQYTPFWSEYFAYKRGRLRERYERRRRRDSALESQVEGGTVVREYRLQIELDRLGFSPGETHVPSRVDSDSPSRVEVRQALALDMHRAIRSAPRRGWVHRLLTPIRSIRSLVLGQGLKLLILPSWLRYRRELQRAQRSTRPDQPKDTFG